MTAGYADTLLSNTALMSDAQNFILAGSLVNAGTGGGSANAQTATSLATVTAYYTGMQILYIAGFTNTSTTTFNLNSLGAKTVVKYVGDGTTYNLHAGDITNGQPVLLVYDGTNFRWHPTGHGCYTTWSPTLGANGSMTYTSSSTTFARLFVLGRYVFIHTVFTGIVGGTPNTALTFTLPITPLSGTFRIYTSLTGTVNDVGTCLINGSPGAAQKRDQSNFSAGSQTCEVQGYYPWI